MNYNDKNKYISIISPEYINYKNPAFIEINEMYMSGVILVNYPSKINDIIVEKILNLDVNATISMFFENLNNQEVIKKITYHLGNIKSDINMNSDIKQDYEILNETYSSAREIRKELQINNEKIFNFCLYIVIFENEIKLLKEKLFVLQSLLYELGFVSKIPYFRHIELYNAIVPYNLNNNNLNFNCRKSMLSKTLAPFYPFRTNTIFDLNGVLFGEDNQCKSLIIIDRFDSRKYINPNMCILGISGAGKSYFVKLQIMRNNLLNVKQLILDPEGEYKNICKKINGVYLNLGNGFNEYINVFEIFTYKNAIIDENMIKQKIESLSILFNLMLPGMDDDEKIYLEKAIYSIYVDKEILNRENTKNNLLKNNNKLNHKDFPIMQDLYNKIDNKKIRNRLYPYIYGKFSYLNNHTNFDVENKTIFINLANISSKYIDLHLFAIIDFFWSIIKGYEEKKIIYIDELWKLINNNKECSEFIIEIFKTIRKYNGAATAITQDLEDLVVNKNIYGKTIINNSNFKCIFKMNEENIKFLNQLIFVDDMLKNKILNIKKGECLLVSDNNHINIEISSSDLENKIIDDKIDD